MEEFDEAVEGIEDGNVEDEGDVAVGVVPAERS